MITVLDPSIILKLVVGEMKRKVGVTVVGNSRNLKDLDNGL